MYKRSISPTPPFWLTLYAADVTSSAESLQAARRVKRRQFLQSKRLAQRLRPSFAFMVFWIF
jgi:hypothetical protein